MNLEAYFDRIGYEGPREPSRETLFKVHRSHLMAVPFENLDIHVPKTIQLNDEVLFQKIVTHRRGGFCFEQNGFFARVLQKMGYEVSRLHAQVYSPERKSFGVPANHMTLLVLAEEQAFLADVGFGASFWEPIPLEVQREPFRQRVGEFWLEKDDGVWFFLSRELGVSDKHVSYRFTLEPQTLESYAEACEYMQTSPETQFTQKRVCSRWHDSGRWTLSEGRFIETPWQGHRRETWIANEDLWHQVLRERFGVEIKTKPPLRRDS